MLPREISESDREELARYIRSVASEVEGSAFWVAGQPFVWYDALADAEERALTVFGQRPQAVIGFGAMCRGPVSEAYLAMLAARVAQMFDGVVAFGGRISSFAADGILVTEGREEHEGQDYLTAAFLHQWIHHPDFRMAN